MLTGYTPQIANDYLPYTRPSSRKVWRLISAIRADAGIDKSTPSRDVGRREFEIIVARIGRA
jgi:hypothetical protein